MRAQITTTEKRKKNANLLCSKFPLYVTPNRVVNALIPPGRILHGSVPQGNS